MKIKQKFIYLFATLVALLAPLSAMAFDINSLASKDIFSPPATDKSITFLSQLFGSVGEVLQGTSGQLLGELLGVLNYGIVLVASCIMVYTVILSIVNTAQEGEFMGRGMKSAWIVVRSVVGLGLLVPQATGYSLAQVIVMWAVVQGVGLADKAWEKSLTYLADRGGVYTAPLQEESLYQTLGTAGQVFQSQICTYRLEYALQGLRKNKLEEYRKAPAANPELRDALAKATPQFGYFTDLTAMTVSFGYRTTGSKLNNESEKICGVYSWKNAANTVKIPDSDPNSSTIKERYQNYSKAALDQMIMDLTPAARRLAERLVDGTDEQSINALIRATLDYENIMTPTVAEGKEQDLQKRNQDVQKAKDDGWIVAGAYYRMIGSWNGGIGQSGSKYQPDQVSKGILGYVATPDEMQKQLKQAGLGDIMLGESTSQLPKLTESLTQAIALARLYIGTKVDPNKVYIQPALTAHIKLANLYNSDSNEFGGGKGARAKYTGMLTPDEQKRWKDKVTKDTNILTAAGASGGALGIAFSTAVFQTLRQVANDDWMAMINDENTDGIAKVQKFGQKLVTRGVTLWTSAIAISGIPTIAFNLASTVAAPFSFMGAGVGTQLAALSYLEAVQVAMKAVTPLLNMVATVLVTNGMVLSVYIPLIPFLVFAFAAIGWLIAVLEAIVAAPLVALGITHPEGHDLMGKAEQATMLLLSVFLRPILMIIGFMAGILFSWVAIKVVNIGFAYAANDIMDFGGIVTLQVIGVIVVYTVIMITVLNTCFTLIHVIPQKVMNWIGLHPEASNVEGMMHEIKGAAHSAGQNAGQAGGHMVDAAASKGAIEGINKARLKNKQKKEGTTIT